MCLLGIFEIFGMVVKKLTAHDKYSFCNRENLLQPNQRHLSQKQKFSSRFFASHQQVKSNFERFEKKDDHDRLYISEMKNCERCG